MRQVRVRHEAQLMDVKYPLNFLGAYPSEARLASHCGSMRVSLGPGNMPD